MPRRARQCPPDLPVHVVQRGHNRQVFFAGESDLKAYANWLHEGAVRYGVEIHAWVFMTNHVHLLLTPREAGAISRCMQHLGRHYVRYFNFRYKRSGTLFEGRFRSSIVETGAYFLACQRYIELNPVRAGMVADPADYSWSSYRAHALGLKPKMWQPHTEYRALAKTDARRRAAYRKMFAGELREDIVLDIRHALNTGLVLGTDRFRNEVAQLTGQRQHLLRRGPKAKQKKALPGEFLL